RDHGDSMKPTLRRAATLGALLTLAACTARDTTTDNPQPEFTADVHSYAQPAEARVRHVSLDLVPEFDTKRIDGTARLAIERAPNADSIVLDIRDLVIRRVTTAGGDSLGYTIGASDPIRGQA